MGRRRVHRALTVAALAVGLLGCTAGPEPDRAAAPAPAPTPAISTPATSTPATSTPATSTPATSTPSGSAGPTAPATRAARPHPVSLPALMARRYDGRGLQRARVLARTDDYTRYAVTYRSGRLTISGIMNVPRGQGPFPVLVLAHGYIDPAVYTTGRGLAREQDLLARRGFVVLHTDYRNHAGSDDDPRSDVRLRLGYTEDVVNAVMAVKESRLRFLDAERVGLLGRSLGGGVVLNALVVRPGLVDAAVIYAPVSSDAVDNFDRWIRGEPGRRSLASRVVAAYGSPERRPAFWRGVSPRTYFDRITEPLLVHHGTEDESCPIRWSRETVAALERRGKDVRLLTYEGEAHAFGPQWTRSMERTIAFYERRLRA